MSQDKIQFFFEGDAYFEALWHDLERARESIEIQVYILEDDAIGQKLKSILINKAKSGLRVKILVDALGSMGLGGDFVKDLLQANILFKRFHPLYLLSPFKKHLNKRNHRKVVIIDSQIGYLGGMNFMQEASFKESGASAWRDTQVRVLGPMVDKLAYYFKRSWGQIKHRSKRFERYSAHNDIVATRNLFGRNYIRHFILRNIKRSQYQIAITSGYFVPDMRTMFMLVRAIKRGVKVQVLTCATEWSDVPLVNRIHRPLLRYLIKMGLEVYYYKGRMLHAKSIFFDDKLATVGSSNINYRSFFRDLEINAFLRSPQYVQVLKKQFEIDLQNSWLVTQAELREVSVWAKAVDVLCYLLRSFF